MKFVKDVHGSEEMAVPVYFNKGRIDIHTNIHEEEITDETTGETRKEWVYDETQYAPHEYMEYLTEQVNDIQMAMVDMYEGVE